MKYLLTLLFILPLTSSSQEKEEFRSDLTTVKKPWTHLEFANDPMDFQFAIITDRTGGPREGIFEEAITKINWLMPEFVITVGDLIRGASGKDSVKLDKQWSDHFARIGPLKMPFFHLAGNHDIKANNAFQVDYWNKLFGSSYYSFVYKEVLFLCLFSNEGTQVLSEEQIDYFKEVLKENTNVRWTMVFLHHPLWRYPHMSNFSKIEESLSERDYTVFAGHQHQYHHSIQNESNYYVLATTGGGSPLLGNSFGSFDHITWVTMSDQGPILANLRLDGILAHDVANDETHALTRQLLQSINVETNVLVDDKKDVQHGKAFVTYRNVSDKPIYLDGRFFHHHQVIVSPDEISITIEPESEKTVEIGLSTIEPFHTKEHVQLEYQGTIGYRLNEYPDLQLTGSVIIPIENSKYQLLETDEVQFVGSYQVSMRKPLPGTTIKYTLDGKDPDFNSPSYNDQFSITNSTQVKACLFTDDGNMKSEVVTLNARAVKPGKGLVIEHYPYDLSAKSWGGIPDFATMNPTKITISEELDPVKVSGRKDQFGLVYKGYITLPESGNYQFNITSDDGMRIRIDEQEIAADPIKHKARHVSGKANLTQGKHSIEIQYFQWKRKYALRIEFITPSGATQLLTSEILSYDQNSYDLSK